MNKARGQPSPALIARLAKSEHQHKYDHGHVLVVAGGPGRTGAARLAARAALRTGAGLVTLACPRAALPEAAAQLTAVMLYPADGARAIRDLLDSEPRLNAICLGPGMGLGPESRAVVLAVLSTARPAVLDADALTVFADDPAGLFTRLHPAVVLTPHMGEFARLFPEEAAMLRGDGHENTRRAALSEAVERAGCTLLLKGARTRIVAPGGREAVNDATGSSAAPWLATAGAGDVLAGLIAGLLARGFVPAEAAELAAFLHAAAGRAVGPGLIAEDLPEALPAVFRSLGL